MRLLQMNLLIFFLLAWTNFMKLKWWWGSWSCFFFNYYKVLIFMFYGILACSNILKSDIYVTNIDLWAPISRCPLFHVHSRMCLIMIFNSFKVHFFIIMLFFLIFFRVTWEWILILMMLCFFYFTTHKTWWLLGLLHNCRFLIVP